MYHLRSLTEKRILAAVRERDAIWQAQRETVTLDEPIQRGWKRHFVLTEAAKQRPDRIPLETILEEINEIRYHWRASFRDGKHRKCHRLFHEHEHRLQDIRPDRWLSLKWPDAWRGYFLLRKSIHPCGTAVFVHRFSRTDLVRLKTERHFITKLPLLDPALARREAEMESWLSRQNRHRIGDKLLRGWVRYDRCRGVPEPRQKMLTRLAAARIRAIYAGDWEADVRALSKASVLPWASSTGYLPARAFASTSASATGLPP